MDVDIRPFRGNPALTKKQIAHAKRILAQWKVTRADSVTYNPEYGWIDAQNPSINLTFESILFTDNGERARNIKQIDDFSWKLKKWPPPHKRQPEPVAKTRPQKKSMKVTRTSQRQRLH
jgi:hypothetical protein